MTSISWPTYSFDAAGREKLESKDDIEKRGVRPPDLGDAPAPISFSMPRARRMTARRGIASKGRYFACLLIGMMLAGAVIGGGSFGPLGDFLHGSTSRHGDTLAEGLLGPVPGSWLVSGAGFDIGSIQGPGEARNPPLGGEEGRELALWGADFVDAKNRGHKESGSGLEC